MARLSRIDTPGYTQHIIQRGNNRSVIFFGEQDYGFFLECLKSAADAHDVDIHAYVLMTNHVHILATPHQEKALSKLMQTVGRKYVRHINDLNQRTGTLWEGRFKSTVVDTEQYLLTCYRYIELNPVRANNMVDHPGDYPYSSYGYHAHGEPNALITDHERYLALGATPRMRQRAYRDLFKTDLDAEKVQALRQGTNTGWAVGDERFKEQIEAASQRRASPKGRGGKRAGAGRPKKGDAAAAG